jgi:capsular exopolysaccharide synthesis family protein
MELLRFAMADSHFEEVREYLAMLHKRRALVATCLGVCLLVATVYNYTTRPVYEATAKLLIDREAPNVLPAKEVLQAGEGGSDYYQTQYELLRGRNLIARVVTALGRQAPEELGPVASSDPESPLLSGAVAAFQSRLSIEPVVGSRLVNLRFRSYQPAAAARAVNTLAQLYIEQALEFRYTTSSEATGWLTGQVQEQRRKVEEAERALQRYREREGLVSLDDREGIVDQKLTSLTAALMAARTERLGKEALYNQMKSLPPQDLHTFSPVMQSTVVESLKTHLAELSEEEARLAETLGDRHPELVRVRARVKATREKIDAEIRDILRSLENAYDVARQHEVRLEASLEEAKREALAANGKAIQYGILKRDVESHQELLRELLSRTKETGLESELKSTNLRIVERADPPAAPVLPRRLWNYEVAGLAGLALGIGLSVLLERMDNTVKTPEDVRKHLALPFLGMIPEVSIARPDAEGQPPLISADPQSAVAEAYRVLRTNLIFSSAEGAGRVLVVSSANPGEGKTTTVANLAASLAQNGARVLTVDADLRRPTLHHQFGVGKTPGVSDVVVGKCTPSQAVQTTRIPGLQAIACGYIPPNPAELLGSESMKEVLSTLRKRYDWVLIDAPPILAMADAPILCPFADGLVLVVWAEKSSRPAIQRALDQVSRVGGKVIGVVLNKVDLARNSYYYSQYYGEYYRSYYADAATRDAAPAVVRNIHRT